MYTYMCTGAHSHTHTHTRARAHTPRVEVILSMRRGPKVVDRGMSDVCNVG